MKYQKLIFYSILFIAVADIIANITNSGVSDNFFTPISLAAKYIALIIFIIIARKSNWKSDVPDSVIILYKMFLICNVITIIRGVYSANSYWDWKFLLSSSILFFLIPLTFFLGKNIFFARLIFKYTVRYLFLFGFLLIPLTFVTNHELYSRLMIPISVFLIFIPYLKRKWRILILLVAIISIALVIDFRTNIIKIAISLLLLTVYYFRSFIRLSWIKIVHFFLFAAPIFLLYLALSGQYNIFAETSKTKITIKSSKGNIGDDVNFTGDSRTFLYVEVFTSLYKNGNVIWGEGASGKYRSNVFESVGSHGQRNGSEVGFLNIILYSGVIGVLIYGLVLFMSSYYAIYRSANFLSKMLGILIAGRWLMLFIEEYTNFDLNTLFTWLVIGLISSREFRNMSDRDLRQYLKF